MADIEGFILAGGASSRMGEDKSFLKLGSTTFVEIIACALRTVASRVSLVSSRPDASAHGLPVVADITEGRGAIGGLHAALAHCEARFAFVVSCDLPFVTPELLARILSLRSEDSDAVAPIQSDGRQQPLCAIYAIAPCRTLVEEMIKAGELRPRELLRRVRTRRVSFDELSDLAGSSRFFRNVNTPDDYAQALLEVGE